MPRNCRLSWTRVARKPVVNSIVRLLIGALFALALATSAPARAEKTHTVTIENMQFNPQELTVRRGERIVWVNKDLFPHTATAAGLFDSGSIPSNGSWSYVAARQGQYFYTCTFHPTMNGRITVQ